jgi:putative drug exporter of the RND superfamily
VTDTGTQNMEIPVTRRRNLAASLGGWSARHRKMAVFGWLLFVVLATVIGGAAGQQGLSDAQEGTGSSAQALQILQNAGIKSPAAEMVLVHSATEPATAPAFRSAVQAVISGVQGTGQTEDIQNPYTHDLISADGHYALVEFNMTGDPDTSPNRVQPVLDAVSKAGAAHPDVTVSEFGDASAQLWFNNTLGTDFKRAELTAVPLALGILLVAFGALLAAIVPVFLALTAFFGALGLLDLISHSVPVDSSSNSVMLLIGLAVGVDYCLFYLRRERQERAAGRDRQTALQIAAATSGRSVLVSGLTVMVAMAGMFLSGMHIFIGFGLASILVVATAMLGSVTVLPALLSMLGDRVDFGRRRFDRRRAERRVGRLAAHATGTTVVSGTGAAALSSGREGGRLWRGTFGRILKHPKVFGALAAGFLIALAIPALGLRTEKLSIDQLIPSNTPIVQTYDAISAEFPSSPGPAQVVVKAPDIQAPAVTQAIAAFKQQAASGGVLGGTGQQAVAREASIQVQTYAAQNVAVLSVPLAGNGTDAVSLHALSVLRDTVVPQTLGRLPGTQAEVGGNLAFSLDFNNQLRHSILPVFVFVLAVTFVVMLFAFRSPVIAGTAIVLNLLSVGAAYGVMVMVFQHGWGAKLVDTTPPGAIESWIPLFVFVVLFGLSMDYHVFVVSRIREARLRGMSNQKAVEHGLRSTAGAVTSAAAIMVAVFAVFGTLSMQDFKQLGVGLAVAVLLDATVIRILLLPSVMTILGERNWRQPRWLGRLPEAPLEEEPALVGTGAGAGAADFGGAYGPETIGVAPRY